jgi:acylphosphatase
VTDNDANADGRRAVHLLITGKVQGVCYRAWTAENARALGLNGWVRNRRDGSVEAVFAGLGEQVRAMIILCRRGPQSALVEGIEIIGEGCSADPGFEVRPDV